MKKILLLIAILSMHGYLFICAGGTICAMPHSCVTPSVQVPPSVQVLHSCVTLGQLCGVDCVVLIIQQVTAECLLHARLFRCWLHRDGYVCSGSLQPGF